MNVMIVVPKPRNAECRFPTGATGISRPVSLFEDGILVIIALNANKDL
jgi:hypothetical protein